MSIGCWLSWSFEDWPPPHVSSSLRLRLRTDGEVPRGVASPGPSPEADKASSTSGSSADPRSELVLVLLFATAAGRALRERLAGRGRLLCAHA